MQIETVDIESLKPYEKNAKQHPKEQIEQIKKSIEMYGNNDPIAVWGDENIIIEGHGRLIAMKELGITKAEIIRLDHLTDKERREYTLVHNQLTMNTDWDFEKLREELDNLDFGDFDFGFDHDLDEPFEDEKEIEEDEVPEKAETRCKLGDLWQLGEHRLICGDSTDVAVIDRLMDGVKADLVFTDPPYGMKKENEGVLNDNLNFDDLLDFNRQWIPLTFGALKDNGSWYCWGIDEPLMDIYSNILKPMQKNKQIAFRNLITWDKGNGQGQLSENFRMYPIADEKCLFVMCGTQNYHDEYLEIWEPIRKYMIGEKTKAGLKTCKEINKIIGSSQKGGGMATHYFGEKVGQFSLPTEEMYSKLQKYCTDNGIKAYDKEYDEIKKEYEEIKKEYYSTRAYFDNTHDNQNNVWHFDRAGKDEREHAGGHATPKPIALCSRAIKSSSREGEIVLDVFGGSGSTLIACEQLNRRCYMCELIPHYCDVILQRWENLTGKKATRIKSTK